MHKDVLNLSIVVNIQVFIAVSKNCSYFFNNFSSNQLQKNKFLYILTELFNIISRHEHRPALKTSFSLIRNCSVLDYYDNQLLKLDLFAAIQYAISVLFNE